MSAFNGGTVISNFSGTLTALQLIGATPTSSTDTGTLIVGGGIGAQAAFLQSETVGALVVTGAASIASLVAASSTLLSLVATTATLGPLNLTSLTVGGLVVTTAATAPSLFTAPTSGSNPGLQVAGTLQHAPKIWITGTDYANGLATGSTSGMSMILNQNKTANKQLGFLDTDWVTSTSASTPMFRITASSDVISLDCVSTNQSTTFPLYVNSDFDPLTDNKYTLGSTSRRYLNIFGVKGSIGTLNATTAVAATSSVSDLLVTTAAHLSGSNTATSMFLTSDIRSSVPNYFQWYATGTSNYQTIANNQQTVVAQFTGSINAGSLYSALGGYSGITSVFFTGTHFVTANIRFAASATGYRQVLLYQNVQLSGGTFNVTGGTIFAEAVIPVNSATAVTSVALSAIAQLNSGDTVSVVVTQNSGVNMALDGSVQNNFSCHRLV